MAGFAANFGQSFGIPGLGDWLGMTWVLGLFLLAATTLDTPVETTGQKKRVDLLAVNKSTRQTWQIADSMRSIFRYRQLPSTGRLASDNRYRLW